MLDVASRVFIGSADERKGVLDRVSRTAEIRAQGLTSLPAVQGIGPGDIFKHVLVAGLTGLPSFDKDVAEDVL